MEDILYYEALLIYTYILLRIRKKNAQKCTLLSGTLYDYLGLSSVTFVLALMERVANNVNIKTGKLQCSFGGIKNIKRNYFPGWVFKFIKGLLI